MHVNLFVLSFLIHIFCHCDRYIFNFSDNLHDFVAWILKTHFRELLQQLSQKEEMAQKEINALHLRLNETENKLKGRTDFNNTD